MSRCKNNDKNRKSKEETVLEAVPIHLKPVQGLFIPQEEIQKIGEFYSIIPSSQNSLENNPYLICEYSNLKDVITSSPQLFDIFFNSGPLTKYPHSVLYMSFSIGNRVTLYLAPKFIIIECVIRPCFINMLIERILLNRLSWKIYDKRNPKQCISGVYCLSINRNIPPFRYVGTNTDITDLPLSCNIKYSVDEYGNLYISEILNESMPNEEE